MPTFLPNGKHVPPEHAEAFARSLNVVQGEGSGIDPAETASEAWARTEASGIAILRRGFRQMIKREEEAANVAAAADAVLTDIP